MRDSLVEIGLYFSSTAFVTSFLLKVIKFNPWFWHILSIALFVIPLIVIGVILYTRKPQEDELLAALKQKEDESDKRWGQINEIFKWWVLRLAWIAIAIQLVFWGYL